MVATVEPGSPADRAGIAAGDMILALDGTAVTGADDLIRILAGEKIGRTVEVETLHNGSRQFGIACPRRAHASRLINRPAAATAAARSALLRLQRRQPLPAEQRQNQAAVDDCADHGKHRKRASRPAMTTAPQTARRPALAPARARVQAQGRPPPAFPRRVRSAGSKTRWPWRAANQMTSAN